MTIQPIRAQQFGALSFLNPDQALLKADTPNSELSSVLISFRQPPKTQLWQGTVESTLANGKLNAADSPRDFFSLNKAKDVTGFKAIVAQRVDQVQVPDSEKQQLRQWSAEKADTFYAQRPSGVWFA